MCSRATASGASSTSVATTSVAPAKRAARAVSRPIGPEPVTMTRLPGERPGTVHRMQAHRQRLGDRQPQQVGVRAAPARSGPGAAPAAARSRPARAESARRCRGRTCPCTGCASRPAVAAGEAGAARIERGLRARREAVNAGPGFDDDAGDLVAQHQRLAHQEIADRAAMVVVQVGAADAAVGDAHPHLIRRKRPVLDRFDAQILPAVTDGGEHRCGLPG